MFEKIPIGVKLSPLLLKRLVEEPLKAADLRLYDQQIYNSVKYLAEDPNLDFDSLDFTYTVQT